MKLSSRLAAIAPSATLALNARARELKDRGRDVVSLTAGEPDFACPEHIVEALGRSAREGATRYTPVAGLPGAREAVADRYRKLGHAARAENVILTVGGKQALFNALMCLLDPGDEVIVPSPHWLSYRDMVQLAGGRFVEVTTTETDGFTMTAEALERHLTPRTKALILNSPANPTGAVYDRSGLEALLGVISARDDVVLIFDEIYDRIVYPPAEFVSPLDVARDFMPRTIVVNGCSKTYAMTGLRAGWAFGPEALITAMSKIQGQTTSNTSAPVQHAMVAALEGDQSFVETMRTAFERRKRIALDALSRMEGVTCFEPRGAFYVFPDIGALLGRRTPGGEVIESATQLCEYLVSSQELVIVPGEPFGSSRHVRLSFATDEATLSRGLERLGAGLKSLRS